MIQREAAWRVFASEYNASTHRVSEDNERSPSYVISPLGAKINRVFVVGVVTDVENIGTDTEPMWRARLSDPTGTFYIMAGQYQPLASQALSEIKPPAFAAVVGKARTYSPEEGVIYVSIRPEVIKEVTAELRDYWVLDSCRNLKKRIEAMREALQMHQPTVEELRSLGYGQQLAEGIVIALEHYGQIDLGGYDSMLINALHYLIPEYKERTEVVIKEETEEKADGPDENEGKVLEIISSLDSDGNGARWEEILERAKKEGIEKDALEEVINSLLDKGLAFEPVLGKIKRV